MLLSERSARLQAHLRELGIIVDSYARGGPGFADEVIGWLSGAETLMRELRLPDSSELAALRTSVLGADQQVESGKRRQARNRSACSALIRGEELLRGRVLEAEDKLGVFESKLIEAVTAAVVVDILPPLQGDWQTWLGQVWAALAGHQATRPTTLYLASALAPADRLIVLDRILLRLTSAQLPVLGVGS